MTNHYHLLVQTPEARLARTMRQLNGVYAQDFNRRHGRDGHLFQGRGKTNHEVAQALFVSGKTVEANLTRIYRKLGVRSRAALAARMREREAGEEPAKL